MLLGAPGWGVGTDSCFRATVMKSSGGEVPGAAALYSFLFNLVVQLADKIPPPSVFPKPTLQFSFLLRCALATACRVLLEMGLLKWPIFGKKIRKQLCFNTAHSCGLVYSFAPCTITSTIPSRQKSVMLKQEWDGRRAANVVNRLCHGRELQHRFPKECSPPAVLWACRIPAVVISNQAHILCNSHEDWFCSQDVSMYGF